MPMAIKYNNIITFKFYNIPPCFKLQDLWTSGNSHNLLKSLKNKIINIDVQQWQEWITNQLCV